MKYNADNRPSVKPCDLKIGDKVIVKKPRRTKASPFYDPKPYIIKCRKGNMITGWRDDHIITRNSSFFKKIESGKDVSDDLGLDMDMNSGSAVRWYE